MASPTANEAFRRLQAGDAAGALETARAAVAAAPRDARAHMACGIAWRLTGDLPRAAEALAHARRLDPADAAAAYESGIVAQMQGDPQDALQRYEDALRLRPGFAAAAFAAGVLHVDARAWTQAAACFREVVAAQPGNAEALLNLAQALLFSGELDAGLGPLGQALALAPAHPAIARIADAFGRHCAARGRFADAARLFGDAWRRTPADRDLPLFIAQCELLEGRWPQGWLAYGARDSRRDFEARRLAQGAPYRISRREALAGQSVELVGEQGLGDILFFLRQAPAARAASGMPLAFAGEPRLHSLLARTGLFARLSAEPSPPGTAVPLLVADLPVVFAGEVYAPSLRIAPEPARVERWRERLARCGPAPYLGVTWRAGTDPRRVATALHKHVDLATFFRALAPWPGTVVSLQRLPASGEIAQASAALGRPVHDFGDMNDDLEDALALVAVLDRHVGVSNTNMHLAAAAGRTADVLVPFPPEWRWRKDGASPWFPGFAVHRQAIDGDWGAALAALAATLAGSAGGNATRA